MILEIIRKFETLTIAATCRLTSKVLDPVKALGRSGILGGFANKLDGGVEILDDLDDHWTAKSHKAERNWLIQELQHLAAEKSVRVTILRLVACIVNVIFHC